PERAGPVLPRAPLELEAPLQPGDRLRGGVEGEPRGVRPLEIVVAGPLDSRDRLLVAAHGAPGQAAPQGPRRLVPLVLESQAGVERGRREPCEGSVARKVSPHARAHGPDLGGAAVEVLREAENAVLRPRLDEEVP